MLVLVKEIVEGDQKRQRKRMRDVAVSEVRAQRLTFPNARRGPSNSNMIPVDRSFSALLLTFEMQAKQHT